MDILLSRIIRYLNGVITDDRQYRTALFMVEHYQELRCKTLEEIVKESEYTEEDIMTFIGYLGYHDYEDFRERLMMDQDLRSSQMQLRLLHTDIDGMISSLHISGSKEDFLNLVDHLAEIIYENGRIILAGGYSPLSVTVDFQTDMISMGKQAVEYHQFDKNFKFKDTDVVFFLTATGRGRIVDTIYEKRVNHVPELAKMGATISTLNDHIIYEGPNQLTGSSVKATDLRAGAALVIAGLMASGTTEITNVEYILRGYSDIIHKLTQLGANIQLVEE